MEDGREEFYNIDFPDLRFWKILEEGTSYPLDDWMKNCNSFNLGSLGKLM